MVIGSDLVRVSRFAHWQDRRVLRVFGPSVLEQWHQQGRRTSYLASRWALAESIYKAVGQWEICVNNAQGQPVSQHCAVTVTHDADLCWALAIDRMLTQKK